MPMPMARRLKSKPAILASRRARAGALVKLDVLQRMSCCSATAITHSNVSIDLDNGHTCNQLLRIGSVQVAGISDGPGVLKVACLRRHSRLARRCCHWANHVQHSSQAAAQDNG